MTICTVVSQNEVSDYPEKILKKHDISEEILNKLPQLTGLSPKSPRQ